MRMDTHVHTLYSGPSTIRPLHHFMRDSYDTPEGASPRQGARNGSRRYHRFTIGSTAR